ncbi:MAG TPA: hypothetical protein VKA09_03110 [Nitrososphaeraceae archaeon]|jgi:hypothetical protein|nr:hypothetical protein [Nitrososphaeraceae archaeon]
MDGYSTGFDDCSGSNESDNTGSSEEESSESEDFGEDSSSVGNDIDVIVAVSIGLVYVVN